MSETICLCFVLVFCLLSLVFYSKLFFVLYCILFFYDCRFSFSFDVPRWWFFFSVMVTLFKATNDFNEVGLHKKKYKCLNKYVKDNWNTSKNTRIRNRNDDLNLKFIIESLEALKWQYYPILCDIHILSIFMSIWWNDWRIVLTGRRSKVLFFGINFLEEFNSWWRSWLRSLENKTPSISWNIWF